jgi:2-methylisocitrate lyase-like PEP mutase family enzyme
MQKKTWQKVLDEEKLLVLPSVHDALTVKLVEKEGFPAAQVGIFSLSGTRWGFPDIDLLHYYEVCEAVREIIYACNIPILVDCDDGYGDPKSVYRTVRGYSDLGVAAVFIEDQKAPKKCGHMAGKEVIPIPDMVKKIRAARAAKSKQMFILARSDAGEVEGVEGVLRRGEAYLKEAADGFYVDGLTSRKDLEKVGKIFSGVPLAMSVLEGGGKTPWIPPGELHEMGFTMILYPTTILFTVHQAIEKALRNLNLGKKMTAKVNMDKFEETIGLEHWKNLENL